MNRFPLRKIFYATVVIFWLVTMAVLLFRHYGLNQGTGDVKAVMPKEFYEEQWMGIYYKGEKTGYSSRKIEKLDRGYKISEHSKMRLAVMDTRKEIETATGAYLDSDFGLDSFSLSLKSDAGMSIRGKVEGKKLRIYIETGGRKSEQTIPLREKPSLNLSIIPNLIREGIKPGRKFSMMIVDPATLSQEQMLIEVTGREKIMSMGALQEAYKVKGSFNGGDLFIWLSEKGEVLREESPMGFTLVREPKEIAMQIGKPSADIISQVAVPFNLKLPAGVSYLRVRISGIDFKGFDLDGGRQSFKGDVLEIQKTEPKSEVRSQKSGVSKEYLEDTMFIQSKDPQIVSLAKEIVKDEKDRLKSARLIYEWVYKNIEKVPTITIPMATEVLKTKKGDCNEHTTLYVALARAAGIPARIAIGLVYNGFFYYHAWPEVYVNQWIAIDPTLGQFPADAAHIRLITGDINRQAQILSVIGKIRIEGLEYR